MAGRQLAKAIKIPGRVKLRACLRTHVVADERASRRVMIMIMAQ